MNDQDMMAAIELMRKTYPDEQVIVTVKREADGYQHFVAGVGECCNNPVYGFGDTPLDAADNAILRAGDRSSETRRIKRVAELRAELAKLEPEPAPEKLAELAQACEMPSNVREAVHAVMES